MRKKILIGGSGLAIVAFIASVALVPAPSPQTTLVSHSPQLAHSADNPIFVGLPAREAIRPAKAQLFVAERPPKPPAAPSPVVALPPPPAAPPMPYRVAGKVVHDGVSKVVLEKGDRIFTVQHGDRLEGGYLVDAIDSDEITLVYEPLGTQARLTLASRAPAAMQTSPAAAGGSPRASQLR